MPDNTKPDMKTHTHNQTNNTEITIRKIYKELIALKKYRPSKRVNHLFTQLVHYVLKPESKNIFTKEEIQTLQIICQRAEYELEEYWAYKIIQNKNPKKIMENFPYIENYKKLTKLEWFSVLSCTQHKTHNICFIGGGPLPLTAILLAKEYGQNSTVLDKDENACQIAKKVIEKLNLEKKITIVKTDAAEYEEYNKFNVIIVAALAGIEKTEKDKIMLKIKKHARKDAHILARSSWGLRELLYRPLDKSLSKLFKPVIEIRPHNDIINSVIIFKQP